MKDQLLFFLSGNICEKNTANTINLMV